MGDGTVTAPIIPTIEVAPELWEDGAAEKKVAETKLMGISRRK